MATAFNTELAAAAADLERRLAADALAVAAGERCAGGTRRLWRERVQRLAALARAGAPVDHCRPYSPPWMEFKGPAR